MIQVYGTDPTASYSDEQAKENPPLPSINGVAPQGASLSLVLSSGVFSSCPPFALDRSRLDRSCIDYCSQCKQCLPSKGEREQGKKEIAEDEERAVGRLTN